MRAKIVKRVYLSSWVEAAKSVDMIYLCVMRKLDFLTLNYAKKHFSL